MLKTITTVFSITFLLFSCQKEMSREITSSTPANAAVDSNYIDTLYQLTIQGGIADSSSYYKFNYDNLKRVVSINWQWGDFQMPYTDAGSIVYSYNGADMLPFKSYYTATYNGATVFDTATTYYFYAANGSNLTKDSVINSVKETSALAPFSYSVRKYISTYTYPSSVLTVRQQADLPVYQSSPASSQAMYRIDSTRFDGKKNPINSVRYEAYNIPASYSKTFSCTATFDDKPNPFAKLNIFKSFNPVLSVEPPGVFDFIGANNFVRYTTPHIFMTNTFVTTDYSNNYLANGYINKSLFTDAYTTTQTLGHAYKYRKL